MPIMVELRPEIEERVLAQAQAQGVSPERYLAGVIEAQVPAVEAPETLLLAQIQRGLPEATWRGDRPGGRPLRVLPFPGSIYP